MSVILFYLSWGIRFRYSKRCSGETVIMGGDLV